MAQDSLTALSEQLDLLARLAAGPEAGLLKTQRTSAWSAAEHIDHTLKVANSILSGVLEPDPSKTPARKFSTIGRIILLLNYIPRGRGRSPEALRGKPASADEIQNHLRTARALIDRARTAARPSPGALLVKHPLFGGMTWTQATRFAVVHTHHHLKILREILGS